MGAFAADVQIYNINYLSNISGAVAVLYSPVQNLGQHQSVVCVGAGRASKLFAPMGWATVSQDYLSRNIRHFRR